MIQQQVGVITEVYCDTAAVRFHNRLKYTMIHQQVGVITEVYYNTAAGRCYNRSIIQYSSSKVS